MRALALWIQTLALLTVSACGGKIAEEPGAAGLEPGEREQTAGPLGGPPAANGSRSGGPLPSPEEACRLVCEHNARCGALQTDCVEACLDAITGRGCSSETRAYITCHAQALTEECGMLPPACEAAYCAHARCRGGRGDCP